MKRIVGPKATGETCDIVIEHGGKMPYWEGQVHTIGSGWVSRLPPLPRALFRLAFAAPPYLKYLNLIVRSNS